MRTVFIHVYSCSSLLCTFCFCRVYVSGISSCPVHPVFFSLNKSVQFSSVLDLIKVRLSNVQYIYQKLRTVFHISPQLDILCTSAVKQYHAWQFAVHESPVFADIRVRGNKKIAGDIEIHEISIGCMNRPHQAVN